MAQLICSFDSFDKNHTVAMVVSLGLASKLPLSLHEYCTMAASLIHPHIIMQGIIIIPSMSTLLIAYTAGMVLAEPPFCRSVHALLLPLIINVNTY